MIRSLAAIVQTSCQKLCLNILGFACVCICIDRLFIGVSR